MHGGSWQILTSLVDAETRAWLETRREHFAGHTLDQEVA